jgi:transcriptional/translational regulatory protein YebC/TACO1
MEIALEAGADDILNNGDHFEVLCPIPAYDSVSKALQEKGLQARVQRARLRRLDPGARG